MYRQEVKRMIGIDKTKVKSFRIVKIDEAKFIANNNVIYKNDGVAVEAATLDDNKYFAYSYLKITDGNIFNSLVMGIKNNKGIPNPYSFVEIHISDELNGNLKPLTVAEYHNLIENLKTYIEEQYGLYLDFNGAKFEEIEINITAEMDRQFIDYEFLLSQVVQLVPKTYCYSTYIGKKREVKQLEFFNKSVQVKIYDKTSQLRNKYKIHMDNQFMRIEYNLCKPKKIKDCIGSEYIYEIDDKVLSEWITSQISKDIIKPINKHIENANKQLLTMVQKEKQIDSRKWTKIFFSKAMAKRCSAKTGKLALVTDIKQVTNIICKMTSKSNLSRTMKRLNALENEYLFAKDNFIKLSEITEKFS